ncbi:MAG: DUF6445 family protein [Cellvibrio sp.]|uniref:DUF6445 family protein n=1 Tax=Cellvibrio sp. TaxID=1965322 RepID=UPI0031A54037
MTAQPYSPNENLTINTLRIGTHKILVIDNFLKQPQLMVEYATQSQFSLYPGYANKKGYPGIRAAAPSDYSYDLTVLLEPIIKKEFSVPENLDIRKSVCVYSLMTMRPQDLGPLQRTPHFDASTPHHIAVLLYLCDEQHGGTAFYRHTTTGLDQITEDTRENYLDIYYEEINSKRPKPGYAKESSELYEKIGMVTAKFNRLVIYKGSMLHAPYIDTAVSIDQNPKTGRLTVNTFYDF